MTAAVPPYTTRTTCRVCGSSKLLDLFSLGEQYVSNFLTKDEDSALRAGEAMACESFPLCPITLQLCRDCTLVQAKHTAPQELLYTRKYWYRSGVTQTMRDALADITFYAERSVELHRGDVVLDIGSNDGTLLRSYKLIDGLVKVGCEPADNMRTYYKGTGEPFLIPEFWSAEVYKQYMTHGKMAKIVTACGMFYDLEDPNAFVQDIAKVLHPDGVFIAQLMCLKNMLAINDLGNLAHEHLEFYSLKSLMYLYDNAGLEIYDIETNKVNGESYRIYAQHKGGHRKVNSDTLAKVAAENDGLDNPRVYSEMFGGWERNKQKLREFIRNAVAEGKKVWVYGASTKGNTMLQYWGLDRSLISGAADRSSEKWGKYTVGTGIPIVSEGEARDAMPDFFLVLPVAFMDEFNARERSSAWRLKGGKFIVPLPEMVIA